MFSTNQLVSKKQLLLAGVMLSVSNNVYASCVPEPYIGSTCTTAANFCPRGYLQANGSLLAISDHTALYSLLGTRYGGNGTTNFQLPDLRGRSAIGSGNSPGLNEAILARKYGSETQTLTALNLPAHTHAASASGGGVTVQLIAYSGKGTSPEPTDTDYFLQGVAQNSFSYNPEAMLYGKGEGDAIPLEGISTNYAPPSIYIHPTGYNHPFSIRSPSLALTYCIAVDGLYPPRG
ncbi:phage tail protein [Vibrio sp. 16]|uniref:phage tail protein n=1 Tax=Vibrio sp. 16 TaxID=391586 RepID=UPI00018F3619|nr:tail fiber protein [Vibrio sp. 16]EED26939.1 phage Tail Collar [Vibrio sp. 16]CAK4073981.1 hypothetical protein VDT1_3138 [Vibrio sp. 16]